MFHITKSVTKRSWYVDLGQHFPPCYIVVIYTHLYMIYVYVAGLMPSVECTLCRTV